MSGADMIREAIAAALESVPNIGRIHRYERYLKNQGELAALYAYEGQLRGWHVRRVAIQEGKLGDDAPDEVQHWQIRGYMAVSDAGESELVFDRLIDAARDRFRVDPTLGGTVATTWVGDAAGLQMQDSGPALFAGVLCHKVVLTLATQRFCLTDE